MDRPDLEKAQRLVRRSGTAGMRVVFEYTVAYWVLGGLLWGTTWSSCSTSSDTAASVRPVPLRSLL